LEAGPKSEWAGVKNSAIRRAAPDELVRARLTLHDPEQEAEGGEDREKRPSPDAHMPSDT
jgi:hypothetical protein